MLYIPTKQDCRRLGIHFGTVVRCRVINDVYMGRNRHYAVDLFDLRGDSVGHNIGIKGWKLAKRAP